MRVLDPVPLDPDWVVDDHDLEMAVVLLLDRIDGPAYTFGGVLKRAEVRLMLQPKLFEHICHHDFIRAALQREPVRHHNSFNGDAHQSS